MPWWISIKEEAMLFGTVNANARNISVTSYFAHRHDNPRRKTRENVELLMQAAQTRRMAVNNQRNHVSNNAQGIWESPG